MSEGNPSKWLVSPISEQHNCVSFDCGKHALNNFLKRHSLTNQSLGIGQTFVATVPPSLTVDGYYCVSAGSVIFANLPNGLREGLPRYPVPVGHIGKLAVALSQQGKGLGEMLLLDALERIVKASDFIGIHAVEVCAKDEQAKAFYVKYGFRELLDDRLHLYISVPTLKKLGLV